MKLVTLYTNNDTVFPAISFTSGFNVVFGRVNDPSVREQDSHNLGKTFLISVIDFALLGKLSAKHPFQIQPDLFDSFVFYLELETVNSEFLTIRRPVSGRSSISIHVYSKGPRDLRNLPPSSWRHDGLSLEKAKEVVNDVLDLEAIRPYTYRKGLGYFLRRQSDYNEVIRISNFASGPDKNWKPFVAHLLGFDDTLLNRKYELEERVKNLQSVVDLLEEESGSSSMEYDQIRGTIELRSATVSKLRNELDSFSFQGMEELINSTIINDIEVSISNLNEQRYKLDYELQAIETSLNSKIAFDLQRVTTLFAEAQIYLPDVLVREYQELLGFNQSLLEARNQRLSDLKRRLLLERENLNTEISSLDLQRQNALNVLRQQETFEKYRGLQRALASLEGEIDQLQQRLYQLNQVANIEREIEQKQQEINAIGDQLLTLIRASSETFSRIRATFSTYVEQVLNVQALLSVSVNQAKNIEFSVRVLDKDLSGRETSEAQGTSYRKILAACFDLTLLSVYSNQKFYRFAYHDGIFEGLDNRKKVALLTLLRTVCDTLGIQHILTVIDSDLPRNELDEKLLFTEDEVIRHLHDQGDAGRLFRMRAF